MSKPWDTQALDETLDYLRGRATDEFLIFAHGAVEAHEQFTDSAVTDVGAIQKSLFAVMVGIAADRGIVAVDDPMSKYLPAGWTRLASDDEQKLTIRHVLTMTTGMDDVLEPLGDVGVTWRYNNTAYSYLKRILVEQTGLELQALTDTWICEPLGMTQTRWVVRDSTLPDGRPITGLEMSGADMGQLGLLVLAGGDWERRRLVSQAYWEQILSPGSEVNPAWGFMWWRNDQSQFMTPYIDRVFERRVIPEAPPELVFTQGIKENRLYVDPTTDRVIVRRGQAAVREGERHNFDRELWRMLNRIWSKA